MNTAGRVHGFLVRQLIEMFDGKVYPALTSNKDLDAEFKFRKIIREDE